MGSRQPPDIGSFLGRLAREFNERGVPYMLIGGQAVLLHGRPRLTEDIDVTLGFGPAELPRVLELCRAVRLDPLPDDLETFVRETFVLPARHAELGIRVDFIFSTTPYEQQAIQRSVHIDVGGVRVSFAAAEDLIIHKLFAGRPRDVDDVAGVVKRKGDELDWAYLAHWANEFSGVPGREEMPRQVAELRATSQGSP